MSEFTRLCAYLGIDCGGVRNCLICGPLPEEPVLLVNPETKKALEEILNTTRRDNSR